MAAVPEEAMPQEKNYLTWDKSKRGVSKRPFRLWDAQRRQNVRWRCFKHAHNAHDGALLECRWSKVGECLEVYDVRNGRLMGVYKRNLDTVSFTKGE